MIKKGRYDWEAFCVVCSTSISIANKSVTDQNEHISTLKHKTNFINQSSTSNIATHFVRSTSEDLLISVSEGALVYHTVSHHSLFENIFHWILQSNELKDTARYLLRNREIFSTLTSKIFHKKSYVQSNKSNSDRHRSAK